MTASNLGMKFRLVRSSWQFDTSDYENDVRVDGVVFCHCTQERQQVDNTRFFGSVEGPQRLPKGRLPAKHEFCIKSALNAGSQTMSGLMRS